MPKVYYERQERITNYYSALWSSLLPNGNTQVYYDTRGDRLIASPTTQGYKDTDWRVKVSRHQDASSQYNRLRFDGINPRLNQATLESKYWNTTWKRWDVFTDTWREADLTGSQLLAATVSDPDIRDIALKRFKGKLSGKIGSSELFVPVVELRETRGLIRQLAEHTTSVLGSIESMSRKHRGLALVRRMQSAWLTYSFGIKPTLSDIDNALDSIANYQDRPKEMHRLTASAKRTWVTGQRSTSTEVHDWTTTRAAVATHTLTYRFTGGLDFGLISGNNYGMAEHLGFSNFWEQLPALGWELTPFSWVIDYFTTMGAYLEDTFELPSGSLKYLVETRHYVGKLTCSAGVGALVPSAAGQQQIISQRIFPGGAIARLTSRTPLASLPHRSLRFKTVDEIGKSAVNKLLNLCSLVRLNASSRIRT